MRRPRPNHIAQVPEAEAEAIRNAAIIVLKIRLGWLRGRYWGFVDHDEPTPCSFAEEGGWHDGHEKYSMLYRCQSIHPVPEEYGVHKVGRHHPEEHSRTLHGATFTWYLAGLSKMKRSAWMSNRLDHKFGWYNVLERKFKPLHAEVDKVNNTRSSWRDTNQGVEVRQHAVDMLRLCDMLGTM
jgi:hypothetical protein